MCVSGKGGGGDPNPAYCSHSYWDPSQSFACPVIITQNRISQGFPGGSVVKNPPASAEDTGLTPGPHAMEQLSQNTTTTELGL